MAIALGILFLIVVTVLFHFLSPWWFTPIAADWKFLDLTVDITFWITGVVFIVLNLFLVWVIIKYRHREGLKAHADAARQSRELVRIHTDVAVEFDPARFKFAGATRERVHACSSPSSQSTFLILRTTTNSSRFVPIVP